MSSSKYLILGLFAVLVLAAVAVMASASSEDLVPAAVPGQPGEAGLDGRVYRVRLGPEGGTLDVTDHLTFDQGLLLSEECLRRCNYPARPYFLRRSSGVVEFISETRCPGKDAWITWRGRVHEDGRIEGHFTWRVERWYWSVEKRFRFDGVVTDETARLSARD